MRERQVRLQASGQRRAGPDDVPRRGVVAVGAHECEQRGFGRVKVDHAREQLRRDGVPVADHRQEEVLDPHMRVRHDARYLERGTDDRKVPGSWNRAGGIAHIDHANRAYPARPGLNMRIYWRLWGLPTGSPAY